MYNLSDLAKITHDEKLRVAARGHIRGRSYAALRAGNRGSFYSRFEDLRVRRGRRAAQAC